MMGPDPINLCYMIDVVVGGAYGLKDRQQQKLMDLEDQESKIVSFSDFLQVTRLDSIMLVEHSRALIQIGHRNTFPS